MGGPDSPSLLISPSSGASSLAGWTGRRRRSAHPCNDSEASSAFTTNSPAAWSRSAPSGRRRDHRRPQQQRPGPQPDVIRYTQVLEAELRQPRRPTRPPGHRLHPTPSVCRRRCAASRCGRALATPQTTPRQGWELSGLSACGRLPPGGGVPPLVVLGTSPRQGRRRQAAVVPTADSPAGPAQEPQHARDHGEDRRGSTPRLAAREDLGLQEAEQPAAQLGADLLRRRVGHERGAWGARSRSVVTPRGRIRGSDRRGRHGGGAARQAAAPPRDSVLIAREPRSRGCGEDDGGCSARRNCR
jgi:hypothetical protein